MLAPGDQIHHYIVEAAIGGGGMATVYRVRHAILQAALALKVLDPKWVDRPDIRKRFLAEGRIQALVRHPAIVMVTDAVVDAPRQIAGLVMEYVEGPNLAELVARMQAPPDPALVRSIAMPVLEAMHHAHGEGVIHRDLKPSNVLLSRDAAGVWHPRVADFGIAHVHEAATRLTKLRVTDTGGRLGTPAFMAPEQIRGGTPDRRWDVFALGCVLYELATGGTHPFERDSDQATLSAIQAGEYRDPREIAPELDDGIAEAIAAALVVDPGLRAPDCATLIRMLDRHATHLAPEPAPQPVAAAPSGEIPPSFVETTGPAHERKAWRLVSPEIRVGREDVEVALGPVANLEAEHCALLWNGRSWVLEDRSGAGTRVNGARVTHIPLEDGDLIGVGHQMLKFHTTAAVIGASEPAEPASPAPPKRPEGPHLEIPAAILSVAEGTDPVRIAIPFDGVVIGRGAKCDISINEPSAAGRHCRIRLQGIDVVVEDLGSAVGTRVDGQAVRFRRLADGARIEIGSAVIRYRQR
ncbi:MAG: protein kinase [Alphaproteobacteria bacterium]|nr:protein kinase [Alphaproteobacteria bacterium]